MRAACSSSPCPRRAPRAVCVPMTECDRLSRAAARVRATARSNPITQIGRPQSCRTGRTNLRVDLHGLPQQDPRSRTLAREHLAQILRVSSGSATPSPGNTVPGLSVTMSSPSQSGTGLALTDSSDLARFSHTLVACRCATWTGSVRVVTESVKLVTMVSSDGFRNSVVRAYPRPTFQSGRSAARECHRRADSPLAPLGCRGANSRPPHLQRQRFVHAGTRYELDGRARSTARFPDCVAAGGRQRDTSPSFRKPATSTVSCVADDGGGMAAGTTALRSVYRIQGLIRMRRTQQANATCGIDAREVALSVSSELRVPYHSRTRIVRRDRR